MRIFRSAVRNFVALAFGPRELAWACVQRPADAEKFTLVASGRCTCDDGEVGDGIIFNPTRIDKLTHSCLARLPHHNRHLRISLSPPSVTEFIVTTMGEPPRREDLGDERRALMVWQATSIGKSDAAHTVFYVGAIRREHLFQYELLALRQPCRLDCITTRASTLLCAHARASGVGNHEMYALSCLEDLERLATAELVATLCDGVPDDADQKIMVELIGLCCTRG